MSGEPRLLVRQVRGMAGRPWTQRLVLKGLGLRGPGSEVVVDNERPIRGMIRKVLHMVSVAEVSVAEVTAAEVSATASDSKAVKAPAKAVKAPAAKGAPAGKAAAAPAAKAPAAKADVPKADTEKVKGAGSAPKKVQS